MRNDPCFFACYAIAERCLGIIPDMPFLRLKYLLTFRKRLNLKDPATYNEKLQWLKLNYRPDLYRELADKISVRNYVRGVIGEEYLIPLLGVWERFSQIDFSELPDRFVLKCTHDSGSAVICTDKSGAALKQTEQLFRIRLKRNFYLRNREWVYKDIRPRILAEPVIECRDGSAPGEYKVFCFDGKAEYIAVCLGKANTPERTNDIYDRNGNLLDIQMNHPNSECGLSLIPECFVRIINIAERLACGIPHVRVDFYEACGKIYFGEMTFFPDGGFVHFDPPEWDRIFGEKITLPGPAGKRKNC